MIVNFEFLSEEPIDNIITAMNYRIDKMVFLGYDETIKKLKDSTELFLRQRCGVRKVVFHAVSKNNLESVTDTLCREIEYEKSCGNELYFDITGGDSLTLVAFGMLAKEYKASLHIYDIEKNRIADFNIHHEKGISENAGPQCVKMNLADFIRLHRGVINENMHKSAKNLDDECFSEEVGLMWQVSKRHKNDWNFFSEFMRSNFAPEEGLTVEKNVDEINAAFENANLGRNRFDEIIKELEAAKLLTDLRINDAVYGFRFKNNKIKSLIWEGGSILEMHIYQMLKGEADDCNVGVHLDWDEDIHTQSGEDVINEIDVLAIKDNIPTFISCKSGKLGHTQAMHALYEIDTVTKRFGGKYARMILALTQDIARSDKLRAAEMGIEIMLCED